MSDRPGTCPAHLRYLRDVSRTEDLGKAVRSRPVYGFSVLGVARDLLEPVRRRLAQLGAQVLMYAEPAYGGHGLLVNPPGVTKWTGVEAYCRRAGIEAGEVLAVGDGDNDVAMLTRAAVAVGVRGGTDKVLDVADHVIDPPNDHGWEAVLDIVG